MAERESESKKYESEMAWLALHEQQMRGCIFRMSHNTFVHAIATLAKGDAGTRPFKPIFCHATDRPPLFTCESRQLEYGGDIALLLRMYLALSDDGVLTVDAFVRWCAAHSFPRTAENWCEPPTVVQRLALLMNYPIDMAPSKELVTGEIYDAMQEEAAQLTLLADVDGDKRRAAVDASWRLCMNRTRFGHHRAALVALRIACNEADMVVTLDNPAAVHAMDTLRQIMGYFAVEERIDDATIDGVRYACFNRAHYGAFFMLLYGLTLLNRSRLMDVYTFHPISNLAHYYARYRSRDASPLAYAAWAFAFFQSTLPRIALVESVARPFLLRRLAAVIDAADETLFFLAQQEIAEHNKLPMALFSEVIHTFLCGTLRPRETAAPAPNLIRATLLHAILNNLPLCKLEEGMCKALVEAGEKHGPLDGVENDVFVELAGGTGICAALWDQLVGEAVHDAIWQETLAMVPRGFRSSHLPALRPIAVADCFLAHRERYTKAEIVLRLVEIAFCDTCHNGKKGRQCAHLTHDIDTRADVDLCDERVDGTHSFAECFNFTLFDHWYFYAFRGVADPSLAQAMLHRIPLAPLKLVCH